MAENALDPGTVLTRQLAGLPPDAIVGIAVSGGGDSMALLTLAREWSRHSGAGLAVATVDHGLRPESRTEAGIVSQTCAAWDLSHQTLTLSGLDGPGNLSANARDARYDALSNWANSLNVETVLLGHTMDDQAETVLMRLARGSGVEGLSGMAAEMHWNGVRYLRPLLSVQRGVLRHYLQQKGIDWIEDPTNEDTTFDRVKARNALAALAPMGINVEGLSATADRMARQRVVLEAAADDLFAEAVLVNEGTALLKREAFRAALPDTALRVLASVLQQIGGNRYRPRFRALMPLYQRIISQQETNITLAHCLIQLRDGNVSIRREHDAP